MVYLQKEALTYPRTMLENSWKATNSNRNSTLKNGQLRGQGQAHMNSTQSADEGNSHEHGKFNREEIVKLRSLLGTLEKPTETSTCFLAFKDNFPFPYALNVSYTTFSKYSVIDSSATSRMTHSSHKFISYDTYRSNRKLATTDNSLSIVVSQGNVLINQAITLKNVLDVLNFSTNLLSIHNFQKI